MAQAGKISEEARKKFQQKNTPRKIDVRKAREYYLIVCEGAKTEPRYFEALVKDLPHPVAEVIYFDVKGEGRVTLSLVEHAIKMREKLEQTHTRYIDNVWVVFDYDDFKEFNDAIARCEQENIKKPFVKAAFTNEAFELWFLLHFNYHDTAMSRSQYKAKLNEAISKAAGKEFKYEKNDPNIYYVLKQFGRQDLAIRFADKLINDMWGNKKDYANHNPRTNVHELVIELFGLETQLETKEE